MLGRLDTIIKKQNSKLMEALETVIRGIASTIHRDGEYTDYALHDLRDHPNGYKIQLNTNMRGKATFAAVMGVLSAHMPNLKLDTNDDEVVALIGDNPIQVARAIQGLEKKLDSLPIREDYLDKARQLFQASRDIQIT